jgi:hypothetical protein
MVEAALQQLTGTTGKIVHTTIEDWHSIILKMLIPFLKRYIKLLLLVVNLYFQLSTQLLLLAIAFIAINSCVGLKNKIISKTDKIDAQMGYLWLKRSAPCDRRKGKSS